MNTEFGLLPISVAVQVRTNAAKERAGELYPREERVLARIDYALLSNPARA